MEEDGMSSPVGGLAHSQTMYVLNLYKAVVEKAPQENAVLSPLSISLALAMVAAGAQGPTLQQMATCLDLPPALMHTLSAHLKDVLKVDASKHGLELSCANSVWVDGRIHLKPSFQNVLSHSYGAEAASVDFVHKVTSSACSSSIKRFDPSSIDVVAWLLPNTEQKSLGECGIAPFENTSQLRVSQSEATSNLSYRVSL